MLKIRAISTPSGIRRRKRNKINCRQFSFETFSSNRVTSKKFRYLDRPTRPTSSTTSIFSQRLTFKNETNKNKNYNILNLMLENNPKKCNYKKIKNKMKEIKNLYSTNTRESYKLPKSTKRVEELYYNYNVLYGQNTSNLIKTYSPSMRPQSSSINKFVKKMNMNQKESIYVFTEDEIMKIIEAKCSDIGIELKEHMIQKFKDYCNAKCKNRIVDLSDNYLGINTVKCLGNILYNFDRISRLNLSKNYLGDKGIAIIINSLKNSISLIYLNIASNNITCKGGEFIFRKMIYQQSLLDLNISTIEGSIRNRLTSIGVKDIELYLKNNHLIEILNLSGNSIKNEGFISLCKGLNHNNSLTSLKISHNEIGEKGIILGLKCIQNLVIKLTILDISKNKIMNEGLIKLTDKLKDFPNLYSLNLSFCGFEFEAFQYLIQVLQYNRKIEALNVSGNKLKSKKFISLKSFFSFLGIKSLNMAKCNLCDESALDLGECIEENCTIKKLNISDNEITDIGFKSFSRLFYNNLTIEYFDCSSNFLTDAGIKNIIKSLEVNTSLKSINVYDNQLHNETANLIIEVLEKNKTLVFINLYYNRIPMKKIDEINKILKSNTEKQKLKLVPDLIKTVKDLEFRPDDFKILTTKIKEKKKEQNFLFQKVKEEDKMYTSIKDENNHYLDIKLNEINKINSKIKTLEQNIREIEKEIITNEKDFTQQENDLKDKIWEKNEELNEDLTIQKNAQIDYDNTYNEIDHVLALTQEKYNLSLRSLNKLEDSLKKVKDDLIEKNKTYEELMSINILSNNIKRRKTLTYNIRNSLRNNRSHRTMNVTPVFRDSKKKLLNIKGKLDLYSINEESKKNKIRINNLRKINKNKKSKTIITSKNNSVASLHHPKKKNFSALNVLNAEL